MPSAQTRASLLLVTLLFLGCAHRGTRSVTGPVTGPAIDQGVVRPVVPAGGRQALLRVRYRGLDGRGRIRLTVRVTPESNFQLAAADVFGRPLWSLGGSPGGSLLLDHRRREVCRFAGDIVVDAIALNELPLSMLPSVLLGELPFAAPAGSSGEFDHVDVDGRRWTARLGENRRPEHWSLWEGEQMLLWWQATPDGAILSHRGGAQVTWTMVADEPLPGSMPPLEAPADYAMGQCDEADVS